MPHGECTSGLERTCMHKVPIFSNLNEEEMQQIAEIITDREYKKVRAFI